MTDTTATSRITDSLNDFSDRLSPMLVKELRQGMRAKLFVTVFLALQGLLALILLTSIAASSSASSVGSDISGIIFMFFSFAVLIVQPLRGVGTLHREIKSLTLELIVLTRLTAWKIVLGKWISIVSQSALIAAAMIPYLVLRYWFGEMNLFGEISLFIIIFILSAVATAAVVGLSCVPSIVLRGLGPILLGGVGLVTIPNLAFGYEFNELVEIASMQTSDSMWGVIFTMLGVIYVGWFCLSIAVSIIAPAAENHATIRRLITLGLFALIIVLAYTVSIPSAGWITLTVILVAPATLLALTESCLLLPPLFRPFARRGIIGRIASLLLAPGWPSGAVFSLLIISLGGFVIYLAQRTYPLDDSTISVLLSLLGMLIMPAALLLPFVKRIKSLITAYMLTLAVSGVVLFVTAFIVFNMGYDSSSALWLLSWLPPVGIIMASRDNVFDSHTLNVVLTFANGIYALMILLLAIPRLAEMWAFLNTCRDHAEAQENAQPADSPASLESPEPPAVVEDPDAAAPTESTDATHPPSPNP